MTQDEINQMVEQAGFHGILSIGMVMDSKQLEAFAALVAAAEREACARQVEEPARKWWSIHCHSNKHAETTRKAHDDFCALQRAIRARGEKKCVT